MNKNDKALEKKIAAVISKGYYRNTKRDTKKYLVFEKWYDNIICEYIIIIRDKPYTVSLPGWKYNDRNFSKLLLNLENIHQYWQMIDKKWKKTIPPLDSEQGILRTKDWLELYRRFHIFDVKYMDFLEAMIHRDNDSDKGMLRFDGCKTVKQIKNLMKFAKMYYDLWSYYHRDAGSDEIYKKKDILKIKKVRDNEMKQIKYIRQDYKKNFSRNSNTSVILLSKKYGKSIEEIEDIIEYKKDGKGFKIKPAIYAQEKAFKRIMGAGIKYRPAYIRKKVSKLKKIAINSINDKK